MRAPQTDLPIVFEDVSILARGVAILDRVTLSLGAGALTVLIGPNGSGKTSLLRAAMGLLPPSMGKITWGGRTKSPPLRRAIVFQRPAMLLRSAVANDVASLGRSAGCFASACRMACSKCLGTVPGASGGGSSNVTACRMSTSVGASNAARPDTIS